ncbi:MAG: NF038122 family metalloprotease [Blastocatellia bacterium]
MKRHIHYAASGMRSILFLTVLGCLLAAGLAGAVFQPASAARFGTQPVAVPQNYAPQIQKLRGAPPAAEAQDHLHGTPLEGGSVLELRDGQISCRAATEAEAQAMGRDPGQQLRVIGDEAFAPNSPEQARKGLKIILRGTPQLEQFPEAKAAFLRAARTWESLIQNPITVVIDVDFGPTVFGKPFGGDWLAETRFQRLIHATAYPIIRSALIQSAGSPQEAALYNSLPTAQLPTDLGAATAMIYYIPAMRALGLFPPVADPDADPKNWGLPPGIAFNSAGNYDFDPSDGIKPKRTDFTALATHEIGHVLGFFSSVGIKDLSDYPLAPEVLDLFRFRPGVTSETFSAAPRILSPGGEQIFFGGGPELPLSTGRIDYTGGDGRQAGHWKDVRFTGRYVGMMDPLSLNGHRYEMTANDREAFELIGYRTNPLPNPQEAELKLDDGTIEDGDGNSGWMVINRLTPSSYPATLRKLRILIPAFQNMPDPADKPITLLIYASGASNGQLPAGAQFTRIETAVPSASLDLFLEFPIPNGPTINSGDFYVGYQAPSPHQGVGFAADLSGSAENRSFYSTNNGASFAPFAQAFQGRAANAMIRALVSIGGPAPTPTPTPIPTPTPTPGPATVALTSGVPQDGYMARSLPDGAVFETQYTIQAPSGATQLKIDLNANTDLDLYVRFGGRVLLQNDIPVVDFKSVSDNHHESITITPASSPALQAGVYYVMLVNYGPGPSTFKITATVNGGSNPTGKLVNVSSASFKGETLASNSFVVAFGERLATGTQLGNLHSSLLGTTVKVTDSKGHQRTAGLAFVSPNQVNYLIPYDTAPGPATVTVTSGDGTVSAGDAQIVAVAPGLFTANGDGLGVPAAVALRVIPGADPRFEPVARYDSAQRRFVPRALDLGEETDIVALVLFGTGLRNHQGMSGVSLKIGGLAVPVQFAGAHPGIPGLDQINVVLPRSLIGRGEMDVALSVDGKTANTVKINVL